jgi:hypothetical protein
MDYLSELISQYRKKGLLIDTNLLLLYFVGMYDQERIPKFKRTMAFTIDEFLLLTTIFNEFDEIITTPNVLTEVSNLSGQLPGNLRSYFYNDFAKRIPTLREHYTSSKAISSSNHFNLFGLTDSGIVETVKGNYLVLTADLDLFGLLQNLGIDAINFNHIRTLAW